jgi:hypothetical protein
VIGPISGHCQPFAATLLLAGGFVVEGPALATGAGAGAAATSNVMPAAPASAPPARERAPPPTVNRIDAP